MRAFDKWITNQSTDLGDFIREVQPHLTPNDTVLLFFTFAKFSHLYTNHRSRNEHEDLSLSLHRTMNTLMEEESTRVLFARLAQNAANGVVGA
tara:strand:- start:8522 stop:8800 length:279 start_codon:yes stop_codon:yes gene_type:complete